VKKKGWKERKKQKDQEIYQPRTYLDFIDNNKAAFITWGEGEIVGSDFLNKNEYIQYNINSYYLQLKDGQKHNTKQNKTKQNKASQKPKTMAYTYRNLNEIHSKHYFLNLQQQVFYVLFIMFDLELERETCDSLI
jgi:hypothetical protein